MPEPSRTPRRRGWSVSGSTATSAWSTAARRRAWSLVDQINAERQAKYADIAQKQGAPVAAVAQIAGTKLIERAGPGEYVMGADGQWQRK